MQMWARFRPAYTYAPLSGDTTGEAAHIFPLWAKAKEKPLEREMRMKDPRKIDYHEHDTPDEKEFPDLSNVASANECTGLMYRVPLTDHELESYQRLSSMEVPKGEQDMKESVQYKLHHSKDAQEAGKAVEEAADGHYSSQRPE